MHSQKIKNGFKKKHTKVVWSGSEYYFGHPESRYALALNPCKLKLEDFGTYQEFLVEVRVEYPPKSPAILLRHPFKLIVEERLFNYLQKEEWLYLCNAIWKTRIFK